METNATFTASPDGSALPLSGLEQTGKALISAFDHVPDLFIFVKNFKPYRFRAHCRRRCVIKGDFYHIPSRDVITGSLGLPVHQADACG